MTKVALPDDVQGEVYERSLAEAPALVGGRQPVLELLAATPMADELTVADLAELFGVSEMQVRR